MAGNGLLADDAAPMPAAGAAPGGAPAPAPEGGDEGGDDSNVTPEEQAEYTEFVTNCQRMIYAPEMRNKILDRLEATGEPLDDLANTAVLVVQAVEASASKAGKPISDEVVFHGGSEVLEDLAEYAEKAKIHSYTEKEIEGAWYRALDIYRQTGEQTGRVNADELKEQFGQLKAASDAGRLSDVLPGVEQAERAPEGQQAADEEM